MQKKNWQGVNSTTAALLSIRSYTPLELRERISGEGVDAQSLLAIKQNAQLDGEVWIPGVELLPRTVHPQRHRGCFGELARNGEGKLGEIGLWPKQWAAASMYPATAKGFHIHPPYIPEGIQAEEWFQRLFIHEPKNFSLRPYEHEQWDVMFFPQGILEMILVDERVGLPRRKMRFWIDGDNHRGANNVGVVIPPGVAHALRAEGAEPSLIVYGTSTCFNPNSEGRISSGIEAASLPPEWVEYLNQGG